ncbi:MAG: hypothetical protein L6R42_000720 [Xanthoria sp. 1 TBL-2021]|nr:MAG: hypothetical protein L6R42_000720 [Xanthoria sp. 1 TBL-2021]
MATVKGTHRGAVDQAKSFIAAMRHQCYCLSEYRICRDVANPNFIRAFEGGRNDCGILVNDTVLTGTLTHKFFQVLRSEGADILPIEIKTLSPCADSRGNIVWSFVFSEQQLQNAQAVIIASLFDPEFVALLPMHYVLKRKDLEPKQGVQESYRPQWSIHPVSAFPVEFSPFIVPTAQLGSALESMRRYAKGTSPSWVNQYTGTTYAEVPPLVPATVEQLLPDFPPWAKALKDLQLLHEAFEEKSEKFIVEMLDIFPLFGDFKIISRDQPDVQIIGECKSNHCEFEFQGRNRVMSHDQLAKGFVGRKIFCWNTQLDVLVTRHSRHPNQALFLPRDMIPHYWWNKDPPDGKLYWPNTDEDMAILKTYVVDLSSKTRIVADIERILLMLQAQRSSMRAQNPVPMKPYEFEHYTKSSITTADLK